MKLRCFDIVDMSISGAEESYPDLHIDEGVLCVVQECCGYLDGIMQENEYISMQSDIDMTNGDLIIYVTCPAFDFKHGRSSKFFDVIEHCKSFSFTNSSDNVVLKLVLGGLFIIE